MRLPMRAFWLYSNSIDRIQAANDQRALRIAVCSQSTEGASGLIKELSDLMGTVTKSSGTDAVATGASNRDGIAALRALQLSMGA